MNRRKINLRDVFPEIPESCYNGLMRTARSVREENPVKRHALKTALITALAVILTMAAAYAAFPSQVADFFGRLYGKETREWLEQGAVDSAQDSIALGGVTFTLNETVHQGSGLYGLISITGEQAENASVYVEKVGVDKGQMILPVSPVGYDSEKQADGSVLYSFEVSDGTAIGKGETFTLLLTAAVNSESREWLVEIHPSPAPAQTGGTDGGIGATAKGAAEVKRIVPAEYTRTGTMPVYEAVARDFGANIQPELFNGSGVAKTEKYRVLFNDGAQLDWAPEALFYHEYTGTYNLNYKNPEAAPAMSPHPSLNASAAELAANVLSGWPDGGELWEGIALEKTALNGVTLEEAKAMVEALLSELKVEGYACDWALDMDTARIRSMGERMNRTILQNQFWNSPTPDYSKVTAENEGFYLRYRNGVKTDENLFEIHAYVTGKGVVDLHLRDLYLRGGVHAVPEKLLDPETVLARLPEEIARSRYREMTVKSVVSIELTYAPARAENKAEGMVLTPAWYVTYYDTEDALHEAFAVFDAVDGTLLNAIFL